MSKEDTITIIYCSRGRRCVEWGSRAYKRCAFPLKGPKEGQTCSKDLCEGCALGDKHDICPPHARLTAKKLYSHE